MELEIIARLVLNLLQGRRIDAYAAAELEKARMQNAMACNAELEHAMAAYWQREGIPQQLSSTLGSSRLPPRVIAEILRELKTKIESRGFVHGEDIDVLSSIYGTDKSECAAIVLRVYSDSQNDPRLDTDEASRKSVLAECQFRVLAAVTAEIRRQSDIAAAQDSIDALTRGVGMLLPPSAVMLLGERYRETNIRQLSHLLEALQQVRDLKEGDQ